MRRPTNPLNDSWNSGVSSHAAIQFRRSTAIVVVVVVEPSISHYACVVGTWLAMEAFDEKKLVFPTFNVDKQRIIDLHTLTPGLLPQTTPDQTNLFSDNP